MESPSQVDITSRRRPLHFGANNENVASRPLVTRPGRSRGHLHRVDPYAASASTNGSASFEPSYDPSFIISRGRPSIPYADFPGANGSPNSNRNTKHNSSILRRNYADGQSSAVREDASLGSNSSSSFSSSKSYLSFTGSNTSHDDSPLQIPERKDGRKEKREAGSNINYQKVTVSRSIAWTDAINIPSHLQSTSTDYVRSPAAATNTGTATYNETSSSQFASRSVSSSSAPHHAIGAIGIGIGPMNHHHPLQKGVLPVTSSTLSEGISMQKLVEQRGMNRAIQYTLRIQSKRIKAVMSKNKFLSSFSSLHRIMIFIMPFIVFVFSGAGGMIAKHSAKHIDIVTKPAGFLWSPDRRLNNRNCVINMFIDKQEPDEFNPDFEVIKPDSKNKDGTPKLYPSLPKLEPGTYRTEGQVKVISRFIASVADSFRPLLGVQQHLVFAGSRDGGHLAEEALKAWPPRGKYRTKLYIIADDEDAPMLKPRDLSNRALAYGPIDSIEQRFQNHPKSQHIHIFDNNGEKAGLVNSYVDDDDVAVAMEEEMFHAQDDDAFGDSVAVIDDDKVIEGKAEGIAKRRAREAGDDDKESPGFDETTSSYFSIKKLLSPYLDHGNDGSSESLELPSETSVEKIEHVIPYFHVDGTSSARQFSILHSARPLLIDGTISVVGVENFGDMDVNDLIEFFHSVRYKTFLLGKRQVMRIDHLCKETLNDLMNHPFIAPKKPSIFRQVLQKVGIVSKDYYVDMEHPHPDHQMVYPPFFVAFPLGRASFEEMTIQHMYDLFGGAGGGGQVLTANDRKAPTKTKKSSS